MADTFAERATRDFLKRREVGAVEGTSPRQQEKPRFFGERLLGQAEERARLTINRFRDTTADTAARAMEQSEQSQGVLGQSVPPEAFFDEGEMTRAFLRAELAQRARNLNPRLSEWAAREPANAIMAREFNEELGLLSGVLEPTAFGARRMAIQSSLGIAARQAERELARAQERLADTERTFSEIVQEEREEAGELAAREGNLASRAVNNIRAAYLNATTPLRTVPRFLASRLAPADTEMVSALEEFAAEKRLAAENAEEAARMEYQRGKMVKRIDKAFAEIDEASNAKGWDRFKLQADALAQDPAAAGAWLVTTVLESAAPALAGTATTLATRSPAMGQAMMGMTNFNVSQGIAEDEIAAELGHDLTTKDGVLALLRDPEARNLWRDRATAYALTLTAVDQMSFGVSGRQLARTAYGDFLLQGLTQAAMGSTGEALALLMSDQDLDPMEIALEGLGELVFMPAERFGATGRAAFNTIRRRQNAENARRFFEALGDTTENSELKAKAPKKYREAVDALTRNGPVETVQIDADGLDQLFQSGRLAPEQLTQIVPSLTLESLNLAIENGGNIDIPTADYAAFIAGSDIDGVLREHLRLNGSLTAAEIEALQDSDMMADLEEGMSVLEAGVADLGSKVERARTELIEELQAAGRTPQVAEAEATQLVAFAQRTAQRLGMTTEEFLRDNPLPRVFRRDTEGPVEVPVGDLTTLRAAGGPEAAVIEAAAAAAGLTEDATNEELAEALTTYTATSGDADTAANRGIARTALSRTLNQPSTGLEDSPLTVIPTGRGRPTIQDVARAMTDDVLSREGRRLDPTNPDDREKIIEDMVAEVEFQLETGEGAADQWYAADVTEALAVTQQFIPELADPVKRDLFLTVAALLSPQSNPIQNWEDAVVAFSGYLRTGAFVDRKPSGKKFGVSSGTSLPLLTFLIEQRGEAGAMEWLLTSHTAREMAELRRASGVFRGGDTTQPIAKYKPRGMGMNEEGLGISMFGPKVSDFMLNATGIDPDAVTVDLWLMRSFGRLRGTLMDASQKTLEEGGIYDQPTTADRAALDDIIPEVGRRTGHPASSVQALLWYYEQRLWRAHGARSDSRNFKEGAQKAAERRGYGQAGTGQPVDAGAFAGEIVSRNEKPVTEEDLRGDLGGDFFGRPGWAILTADNSELADSIRARRNAENEQRLRKELEEAGIPYRPVTGFYGTPEPERSFVILANEETATRLGRKYGQDSVLTRDGFQYTKAVKPPTPPTGRLLRGQAAIDSGFFSRDDAGYAFALEMDFDRGPGNPVFPFGTEERADRPQLPVRPDGTVALHHWSDKELDTVDPAKAGTGPLKNIGTRGQTLSFFGINPRENQRDPGTGYVKESGLGDIHHMARVQADRLYPWYLDPDGLRPDGEGMTGAQRSDEYRRAIKKAGYIGFYVEDDGQGSAPLGNVAALFEAVPVERSVEGLVLSKAKPADIEKHPDVQAAIEEALSREPTATAEQMQDAEFREGRTYEFDGEQVTGVAEAVTRLEAGALTLAWDELGLDPEPVAQDRVAVILMGPPAAGKSTDANRLAAALKAAIVDSDEAKKVIPGYDGGIGAAAVHEESSFIGKRVLENVATSGYNMVVPKVGDSAGSIETLRKQLATAGYEVHLMLKDVPAEEAFRRMYGRFAQTGRLIDPRYMKDAVQKPRGVYEDLLAKGDFDGYERAESLSGAAAVQRDTGSEGRPGDAGPVRAPGQQGTAEAGAGGVPAGGEGAGVELSQAAFDYTLPDLEKASPGPVPGIRELATRYMEAAGLPVRHQASYVKVDVERATEIARLYEEAEDRPGDPEVRAAYEALSKETIAQYEALLDTGMTFEWIEGDDPYGSPADAIRDMQENNHLWVFPTTEGFGTLNVASDQNPLLQLTDYEIDGRRAMVNDLFRIVHDVFGHGSEGASFGPRGEENAWQAHVRMFSPLAARAMTTETRGQNSWVNYGPYGEQNRANPAETIFADQKTTLLPEWVSEVGQAADMPLGENGQPRPAMVIPTYNLPRGAELFQSAEDFVKDSAVKDIVYHGSLAKDIEVFDTTRVTKRGQGDIAGTFFSADPMTASNYARSGRERGGVYAAFLRITNPLDITDDIAKGQKKGLSFGDAKRAAMEKLDRDIHDGVVFRGNDMNPAEYVVFKPEQIKSTKAARFDPTSPKIMEQKKRGSINLPTGRGQAPIISLFQKADLSTVIHESGHYFLWTYQRLIENGTATPEIVADYEELKSWWRGNSAAIAKEAGGPVTVAAVEAYLNKGTTGDEAVDAAIYVGMQELFARSYEAYIFEGKAPSTALSQLFETLSAWLVSIYRTVRRINTPIDDEVRGVFDRMLATEEEIQKARAESEQIELIARSAEEMGVSEEEYADLVRLSGEAQDEARRLLLTEIMAPMQAQHREEAREARERIRRTVEDRVNAKPVHRVREWLGNGRWLGDDAPASLPDELRLDRDLLIEEYGREILKELPRGRRALFLTGTGLTADEVATWFGFRTGEDMINALKEAPRREDEIKAETERLVREEVGDPLVDGSIPDKALAAINGDKRGALIAGELRALSKNASRSVQRTTRSAARQAARKRIALSPVREAMKYRGFLTSMQRAGQRAQEALGRGDYDAAYDYKRKEMLNHALYMEAREAAENVAKWERKVARLKKPGTRKNIDGEYLSAIDEIMDKYDFRRMTISAERRRGALAAYVEMMREQGREGELAIPEKVLRQSQRVPYKTLPYRELRGVIDAMVNIEHTGRRKKKLIDAKEQRDLDAAVQDALTDAEANVTGKPPARTRGEEGFGSGLRNVMNLTLNADTLLREYDGFDIGKMYRLIKEPLDRAANTAQDMRVEASEKLEKLYSVYTKAERRAMSQTRVYRELGTRRAPAPKFSKWDMVSMALNMGNEENLARLMDKDNGAGLTKAQVDFVKDQLSDKDWDFVENVWAYVNEFWPLIEAREKRQTGVVPEKVEAVGFELPNGRQIKGGYYPISYDPRLDHRTEAEEVAELQMNMMAGRFGKAQTRNGHTKERASGSGGRVLEIGMHVLHQHVAKVTHDLAYSEAVNNTWRILQHPDMVTFFEERGRTADRRSLEMWVQDVATGPVVGGGPIGRAALRLKSNFTLSKLAFNMSTVLVQLTGVAQSAVVVGKLPLTKAYAQYYGGPQKWNALVKERSSFMRERETTFHRDIYDLMGDTVGSPLDNKWRQWQQGVGRIGFWLMQKVQYYGVDMPTWIAAYNTAVEKKGLSDEKAIHYADRMVARAQASGLMGDRTAFERGTLSPDSRQSGFIRLFTALGSYMFAKGNIAYERVNRGVKEADGLSLRTFNSAISTTFDIALLFTLEAVLYNLIKGTLPGDDEDDGLGDDVAAFLAKETVYAMLGSIPLVREASSALQGYGGGGAYGAISETVSRPMIQAAQGEVDVALLKAVSNATGVATGFPSAQTNRVIDGLWRTSEGDDVAPIEFLMGARE